MSTLYLVGQFKAETPQGIVWEFQGVFETRDLAVAACRDDNYCVSAVTLNESLPHATVHVLESFYPLAK